MFACCKLRILSINASSKKLLLKLKPVLQTVFFMLCYFIDKKMHVLNASSQT